MAVPAAWSHCRACLLILAISAMGGGWLLEQPSTSCVEWHPRVRLLWRLLPEVGLWPKDVVTISKEVVVKLKWFYSLSWYYMRKCPAVCRCSVQSGGLACMGPPQQSAILGGQTAKPSSAWIWGAWCGSCTPRRAVSNQQRPIVTRKAKSLLLGTST